MTIDNLQNGTRNKDGQHLKKYRMIASEIKRDTKARVKQKYCMFCGDKKVVKSHSIPQRNLKELGNKIKVFKTPNNLVKKNDHRLPGFEMKDYSSISTISTFYSLCNKCDTNLFKDYENQENLIVDETALQQVALKSLFLEQYKKMLEREKNLQIENSSELNSALNVSLDTSPLRLNLTNHIDEIDLEIFDYLDAKKKNCTIKHEIILDVTVNELIGMTSNGCFYPFASTFEKRPIYNSQNLKYGKRFGMVYSYIFSRDNKTRIIIFYRKKYFGFERIKKEPFFQTYNFPHILTWLLLHTEELVFSDDFIYRLSAEALKVVYSYVPHYIDSDQDVAQFQYIFHTYKDNIIKDI